MEAVYRNCHSFRQAWHMFLTNGGWGPHMRSTPAKPSSFSSDGFFSSTANVMLGDHNRLRYGVRVPVCVLNKSFYSLTFSPLREITAVLERNKKLTLKGILDLCHLSCLVQSCMVHPLGTFCGTETKRIMIFIIHIFLAMSTTTTV